MTFSNSTTNDIKQEPSENFDPHEERVMDFLTSKEFNDNLDEVLNEASTCSTPLEGISVSELVNFFPKL